MHLPNLAKIGGNNTAYIVNFVLIPKNSAESMVLVDKLGWIQDSPCEVTLYLKNKVLYLSILFAIFICLNTG